MWKQELRSIVVSLFAIFAFRSAIAEPYVVPTGSMLPTIVPGDHLIVNKLAYGLKIPFTDTVAIPTGTPQRGDIVVFRYPEDPSVNFVKRLIGLPGDHVVVQDGNVTVNGVPEISADLKYSLQRLPHAPQDNVQVFDVPNDHYFFMGDNRDDSKDSRFWGFVPKSYLKGKAERVWYSLANDDNILPNVRWNRTGRAL